MPVTPTPLCFDHEKCHCQIFPIGQNHPQLRTRGLEHVEIFFPLNSACLFPFVWDSIPPVPPLAGSFSSFIICLNATSSGRLSLTTPSSCLHSWHVSSVAFITRCHRSVYVSVEFCLSLLLEVESFGAGSTSNSIADLCQAQIGCRADPRSLAHWVC